MGNINLDMEDEGILILSFQKNPDANSKMFGILYNKYYKRVYKYLYSKLRNRELSEDLTQDSFMRAFTSLQNTKVRNFGSWIVSIAHSRMCNRLISHRHTEELRDNHKSSIHSKVDLEQQIIAKDIARFTSKLHPKQKEAVKLMYIEGFSVNEITRMPGHPKESTIRSNAVRGIQHLRRIIA
jgi:RNA polymerase sigma-70 factor, ECF subfamily